MSHENAPENPAEEASEKGADPKKGKKRLTTGVAVGIGSAAIVAALLYTNRSRKTDRS